MLTKNYVFAYYNYSRNSQWNTWMSQVHVAKPTWLALVAVHGLCCLNLAHSFSAKRDRHNQPEKRCSEYWVKFFVTILIYFPKRLSFKIHENLYWILLNRIGLTWLNVYNKISLNWLQSSWFQIQYNAISAKFIELSSCCGTYTTEHVTITIIRNCTRFT